MLLWKLAFKNLFVHRMKTLVTGLIIVFGTTLAVVGNSLVDAISGGMQRSLTQSLTGEIQIYSSDAKEKIAVLGGIDGNLPDIGFHKNFKEVKDALLAEVPNIKEIVPMGLGQALFSPGNLLDVKIEELRQAFKQGIPNLERIEALKSHIREVIVEIKKSQQTHSGNVAGIFAAEKMFKDAPADLARATSPEFWSTFNTSKDERIEFLANKMAPMILDDSLLFFAYIGTVPELFKNAFSQFEIVKGEMIPEGKRGYLFSDYIYETQVKHRVARRLDSIKEAIVRDAKKIASEKDLQDKIAANIAQAAEIYSQIDPAESAQQTVLMKKLLDSKIEGFPELVGEFLKMDDTNAIERIDYFYKNLAPKLILYKVGVGDVFSMTGFSKTGYSSSLNLKVYGTYRFKSFEKSPLASNFNIMDMISFRKLFGFVTEERRAENLALAEEMGLSEVNRDNVESLFSSGVGGAEQSNGDSKGVSRSSTQGLKGLSAATVSKVDETRRNADLSYSKEEMENGVFLNAAIILKNPDRLSATLAKIQKVSKDKNLGIQASNWQEAAGVLGQMTIMIRGVLYLFVFVIFSVAAFIIMNSMLMATLERAKEIGTMRAIGAQRRFLLGLFLRETSILSFVFGILGTLISLSIIGLVNIKGIPAMGDVSTFFFSGNRLFLPVHLLPILLVVVAMTLVALLSTQYPAYKAMRISPLEAMGK